MKRRYDLVFSIGAACACTECLRGAGLQFSSFPFDWLAGSTLTRRTDILVDGCDDWLRIADLEHVYSVTAIRTDAYRNNATGITFNHDFPAGVPLEQSIGAVREKYDRRFERLRSLIARGGRVLAVYATPPPKGVPPTAEEAAYCRRRLTERFPTADVEVQVLRSEDNREPLVEHPSEGVTFVMFDYRSRTDPTGANPIDRDRVTDYFRREGYAARDYRSSAERAERRAHDRAKEYKRFGASGRLSYWWNKAQYKLFVHLRKRLAKKGLA